MARRDTEAKLTAVAKKLAPSMRRAFVLAMQSIEDGVVLARLENAVRSRNAEQVLELLQFPPSALAQLEDAIAKSVVAGGEYEAAKAPVGVFKFRGNHPEAMRLVAEQAASLVENISAARRDTISVIMQQALADGQNPRQTAMDIIGKRAGRNGQRRGGLTKLSEPQAKYVLNMRRELKNAHTQGGGNYFSKTLRNKRYDATVRRAIATGKPLDAKLVARLTDGYADKMLQLRARTIARGTIGYMNKGRLQAVDQMVESKLVDDQDVTKIWHSTGDNKQRDTHATLNGTRQARGEAFVTSTFARLLCPGDSSLGAPVEETVNCRCWMEMFIDFIAARRRARARGL